MQLDELYRPMLRIRLLEDELQSMAARGDGMDWHFNKGQEAIAVGVCSALRPTDRIVCHHRTIAHHLAKGGEMVPLIAELLGRQGGCNGGRAGEMHLSDPSIGHMFSFQLVGTCIPVAAGIAYALKQQKSDDVVAVFFGDAATANGQFHEGANMAAVLKLPLLLVCENNGRAGNVTREHYQPVDSIAERMRGYGIDTFTVDGNEVTEVRDKASYLLDLISRCGGPRCLECVTERLCRHKVAQGDIRTQMQLTELSLTDPLLLCRKRLYSECEDKRAADLWISDLEIRLKREVALALEVVQTMSMAEIAYEYDG